MLLIIISVTEAITSNYLIFVDFELIHLYSYVIFYVLLCNANVSRQMNSLWTACALRRDFPVSQIQLAEVHTVDIITLWSMVAIR